MNYSDKIGELIGQDKLEEAIQELHLLLKGSKKIDEIILQSSRYNGVVKQIRLGTIDFSDAELTKNQIRFALLDLVREIEDASSNDLDVQKEIEFFQKQQTKLITEKLNKIYPELYSIIIDNTSAWYFNEKKFDIDWADSFLQKLSAFYRDWGIYFSHDINVRFYELSIVLFNLKKKLNDKQILDAPDIEELFSFLSFDTRNEKVGLLGLLKNGIGTFMDGGMEQGQKEKTLNVNELSSFNSDGVIGQHALYTLLENNIRKKKKE